SRGSPPPSTTSGASSSWRARRRRRWRATGRRWRGASARATTGGGRWGRRAWGRASTGRAGCRPGPRPSAGGLGVGRKIGDRQGMVASLLDLGSLERDLGELERALVLLREGRALARDSGERLYECSLAIEIGDCQLAGGRPRDALKEFTRAREIARQF